jgi:hypothetical protein
VLFVLIASAVAFGSTMTVAQTRPHRPARHAKADAAMSEDAGAEATHAEVAPLSRDAHDGGTRGSAASSGKDVVESKTLDGGAKVFRFGEVEIEGRLQSPQLVYFLRRVRAEFAAGDLGHRSFMRELSDTRRDPSF